MKNNKKFNKQLEDKLKKIKALFLSFYGILIIVLITIIVYFIIKSCTSITITLSDFIIFITFEAILYYTYFTYKLYKQETVLSASIVLKRIEYIRNESGQIIEDIFQVKIQNHCVHSIKCWCKVTAYVLDNKYELNGFYGCKEFRTVQPFGSFNGIFKIQEHILSLTDKKYEELCNIAKNYKDDEILKFDLEFYYTNLNDENKIENPVRNNFYNFKSNELSLY